MKSDSFRRGEALLRSWTPSEMFSFFFFLRAALPKYQAVRDGFFAPPSPLKNPSDDVGNHPLALISSVPLFRQPPPLYCSLLSFSSPHSDFPRLGKA